MVAKGREQVRHTHKKTGTRSAPKFPHHPAQRARKLREEWIAKKKIKNAYHSQIRSAALSSSSKVSDAQVGQPHPSASSQSALPQPSSPPPQRQKRSNLTTTSHTAPSRSHSGRQKRQAAAAPPNDDKATRARELLKEAYSPASLHTFKSDPLHKHEQRGHGRGRGRGVGSVGLGGAKGRGQPDMRKRMGALLAQIEAHK